MLKIIFDKIISIILIIFFIIPILIIIILIKIDSKGPIFYTSIRIGKNNKLFKMPKFRTMKVNTPELATHKLPNYNMHITRVGKILRSTSLDEIPQIFTVFFGNMSLVGPRPALYNQADLIKLRTDKMIDSIKPGITGYAQINGRDNLSIKKKVEYDYFYLTNSSFYFDLKILFKTFIIVILRKNIKNE